MKVKVLTDGGYEVWLDEGSLNLGSGGLFEQQRIVLNKTKGLRAYVKDEDVTDRMEKLDAVYYQGNVSFGVWSLEDKLSGERIGDFYLVFPKNELPAVYWGGFRTCVTGFCTIESPRRPEFDRIGLARWGYMPDNRLCIFFEEWDPETRKLEMVSGTATADDDPWNWHYGLMIRGTIAMLP